MEEGDNDDDGDVILLNSNSVTVQTAKLSVIHPAIILGYYKCFRDLFQRTSSDLSIH